MTHETQQDDFTDDFSRLEKLLAAQERLLLPGDDENFFTIAGRFIFSTAALVGSLLTLPAQMALFILEEAAQTTALPTTVLLNDRRYEEAAAMAATTKRVAEVGARLTTATGILAPFASVAYGHFFHSAWSGATAMLDVAERKLAASRLAPTGRLRVTSAPDDAAILIDGAGTPYRTPQTLKGLTPGPHAVTVSRADRKTGLLLERTETVTVPPNDQAEVRIVLPEPAVAAAEAPAVPESRTRLRVESRPSSAHIILDGTETHRLTPETFKGLSPGPHTVELRRLDTETGLERRTTETVDLAPDGREEILLDLPPTEAAPPAPDEPRETRLNVTSSPSGARIFIDGTETPYLTPETIRGLSPGPHSIELVRTSPDDGPPLTASEAVTVTRDVRAELHLRLSRLAPPPPPAPAKPSTGFLRLTSSPSNASIWINGRDSGLRTPESFADVPAGSHDVRLEHVNARTGKPMRASIRVEVTPGGRLERHVTLLPVT